MAVASVSNYRVTLQSVTADMQAHVEGSGRLLSGFSFLSVTGPLSVRCSELLERRRYPGPRPTARSGP